MLKASAITMLLFWICTPVQVRHSFSPTATDQQSCPATNLTFGNIVVKTHDPKDTTQVLCDPTTLAEGEQDSLGFVCQDGEFTPK
jgi:hypothetical protein